MPQSLHESTLEQLERAVSRLRPIEREILSLNAREGLRLDEIALRLNISAEQVERHFADALYWIDRGSERKERRWWRFW